MHKGGINDEINSNKKCFLAILSVFLLTLLNLIQANEYSQVSEYIQNEYYFGLNPLSTQAVAIRSTAVRPYAGSSRMCIII